MSKLPSVTSSDGKTTGSITHVTGGGNSDGGYVSTGAKITHDVGPNTQVFVQGDVGRSQSFHGQGGQNSYGGKVGVQWNF